MAVIPVHRVIVLILQVIDELAVRFGDLPERETPPTGGHVFGLQAARRCLMIGFRLSLSFDDLAGFFGWSRSCTSGEPKVLQPEGQHQLGRKMSWLISPAIVGERGAVRFVEFTPFFQSYYWKALFTGPSFLESYCVRHNARQSRHRIYGTRETSNVRHGIRGLVPVYLLQELRRHLLTAEHEISTFRHCEPAFSALLIIVTCRGTVVP